MLFMHYYLTYSHLTKNAIWGTNFITHTSKQDIQHMIIIENIFMYILY